jgi:hypothetical protein
MAETPKLEDILKRDRRRPNAKKVDPIMTEVADEKRLRAYDMRLKHMPLKEIAKRMKVDIKTVNAWLNHVHEKKLFSLSQAAERIKNEQFNQYDALIDRFMPLALAEELNVHGTKVGRNGQVIDIELEAWESAVAASEVVMRAMQQKAKIAGLGSVNVQLPTDEKGRTLPFQVYMMVQNVVKQQAERETKKAEVIEND